ncbi:MAG TPA: L,D-transpeptidase family protein [Candidatus Eisenbacteria bacterium]
MNPAKIDAALVSRELGSRLVSISRSGLLSPLRTAEVYRRNGGKPVFLGSASGVTHADRVVTAIKDAGAQGINPARYRPEELDRAILATPEMSDSWWERLSSLGKTEAQAGALANADLVLTDRYLAMAADLKGITDKDSAAVDSLLRVTADRTPPIEDWAPEHEQYRRLIDALAVYRQVAEAGGWPRIDAGEKLVKGNRGTRVGQLRARLDAEARLLKQFGGHSADSLYGEPVADPLLFDATLKKRVADFQARASLENDGVAGKGTLAELNLSAAERVRQIERTLERWRRGPRVEPDRRLEVIVPGMWLDLYEGGKPVLTLKTVVGSGRESAEWKGETSIAHTPELIDEIERIEINPKWHIPEIIIRTELLAKEKREPGFLDKGGYEWYEPGTKKFGPASELPDSIWTGRKRLYLRQRSGDANALGKMKFLFPNPYAVYLHDTPDKKYFNRTRRAFSHGCVRVQNPTVLAESLLAHTTTPPPKPLGQMLKTSTLYVAPITPHVPIHLLYRTTWVEENGRVRFLSDLYGWDAAFDSLTAEAK